MDSSTFGRAARACAGLLLALLLLACGGGGGGVVVPLPLPPPPAQPVDGAVSASFTPSTVRVSRVSGQTEPTSTEVKVALNYTGTRSIYIGLNQDGGLLEDYGTVLSGPTFDVSLRFQPVNLVGLSRGELRVRVCFDVECTREVQGSPVRVALEMDVVPNLQLPGAIELARSGRDAAPSMEVPVPVPPGAGALAFATNGDGIGTGITLDWTGSAIRVQTTQMRAGRYERQVTLTGIGDTRYRATTTVVYTVHPPASGEQALRVDLGAQSGSAQQGQTLSQRLQVVRPTWTDAFGGPFLTTDSARVTLHDLGSDVYELRFDTAGLPVNTRAEARVGFSAGPTGGYAEAQWLGIVAGAFSVGPGLFAGVDADSTAAALRLAAPVLVSGGPPARWSARALAPGLRFLRSSGTTDVEAIELEVDPALVLATGDGYSGSIEVSLDRPGTLPIVVPVGVGNGLPTLTAALRGPLLPGSNVVYVDSRRLTANLIRDRLRVTGAALRAATLTEDHRFVSGAPVLRLDLDGATAGQDVVVRLPTPLQDVAIRIPVVSAPLLAAGHLALPLASWRSPQFSLRHGALYFAAPGRVARWAAGPGGWSLTNVELAGSEDAALFGDESRLIAVGGEQAWRLDPLTLGVAGLGSIASPPFWVGQSIDPRVPDAMGAVAMAADGAVNAAIRYSTEGGVAPLGIGARVYALTDVYASPGDVGAVGSGPPAPGGRSVGLVRSTLGDAVVGQLPTGMLRVHRAAERVPQFAQTLPAGVWARAVSDDGQRVLASDGVLWLRGVALSGSLATSVPAGFLAGGWGLSGHGRWALMYVYRIADEAGAPRARDAQLWVFDLSAVETVGVAAAPVLAKVALTDAVGCTAALAAGEACVHAASIVTAPGDGHAFVLGPRGVASVPLSGLPAAAAARRAKASAPPAWRPVGSLPGSTR